MKPTIHEYIADLFSGIPAEVAKRVMIGGGGLRSYFDGTPLADVDLFFRSEKDFKDVDMAFLDATADMGYRYTVDPPKGRTEVYTECATGRVFNLIGFQYGDTESTLERFDFRCCRMLAWLAEDGTVCFNAADNAVADAEEKRLVVLVSNGDDRTERRIEHYINDYGYALDDTDNVEHLLPEQGDLIDAFEMPTRIRRYVRRVPKGMRDGNY